LTAKSHITSVVEQGSFVEDLDLVRDVVGLETQNERRRSPSTELMHSVGDAFAAGQGRFIAPLGRRKKPAAATADNAAAKVDDAAAEVDDAAAGIAAASASWQRACRRRGRSSDAGRGQCYRNADRVADPDELNCRSA
ncbi:hypothetical protein, partial [Rhodococcus aetherivorans]|uniref:hypothetical protein n=1 Tax=Rhodococcus aetherivorans TaxID=191292 RepID=UPI001C88CF9E